MKHYLRLFLTGAFIGLMLMPPLALVGCGGTASRETTEARDRALAEQKTAQDTVDKGIKLTVAQATSNLDAVGGALERTGREPEGKAIQIQSETIDNALGITPLEKPMAKVSQAEWEDIKGDLSKATGALSTLKTEAAQLRTDLDAAKAVAEAKTAEAAKWQAQYTAESKEFKNTKFGAICIGAAGVGLWAARALGVPGIGVISDPLMRMLAGPVLKPIEARATEVAATAGTAATVVMSSDIGRAALGKLDRYLGTQNPEVSQLLAGVIGKATGGTADSIEGLFKKVAAGVAMDAEKTAEAAQYLTALRSKEMETHLGEPKVISGLFTA
jgi:hypothetical protein